MGTKFGSPFNTRIIELGTKTSPRKYDRSKATNLPHTVRKNTNTALRVFYAWQRDPSARSALESELSIGILA